MSGGGLSQETDELAILFLDRVVTSNRWCFEHNSSSATKKKNAVAAAHSSGHYLFGMKYSNECILSIIFRIGVKAVWETDALTHGPVNLFRTMQCGYLG